MKTSFEYLVIGAGPAGLQLGYFFEKNGRDYLILDKGGRPGTFFEAMPRHRQLISINKVYTGKENPETNLRWDWNSLLSDNGDMLFKNYSRDYFPNPDALCQYLVDYANFYDIKVKYDTEVVNVSKQNGQFVVTDAMGNTYTGRRLVVATGILSPTFPTFRGRNCVLPMSTIQLILKITRINGSWWLVKGIRLLKQLIILLKRLRLFTFAAPSRSNLPGKPILWVICGR